MCRLHDDTPSLMRVWFLELWEGCVAQYAVYSHRATGAISQGGYWHWISKRRGLGIGCWSLGNCNSWHLWQLSPLQLDLRIQLCMVVRMCVCLLECICMYEAIWSTVKISTVESPRDKAHTDIVPPWVGQLSLPLSSSYRALWTYEDNSPVHHEQAVLQDHTWSGPHKIPDTKFQIFQMKC